MNLSRRSLLQALAALPGCAALARGSSEPETPPTAVRGYPPPEDVVMYPQTAMEVLIEEEGKRPYTPSLFAGFDIAVNEPLEFSFDSSLAPSLCEVVQPWKGAKRGPDCIALESVKKGERFRVRFL